MKDSMKYKLLATFVLLFVALFSLSFGFLVATSRTQGNVAYWVFKGIVVAWIVIDVVAIWLKGATFSKIFPSFVLAAVAQIIPVFMRIGWHGDNPKVPVAIVYIFAFILFLLIAFSMLLSISHRRFKEAEDKAIPSSNSK